jgi:hypothetical protein
MIPVEMTGGWVRNGIELDGAAPVENTLVWWLQAPSKHCDLRVPLDTTSGTENVMSFGGTTTWADPCLTWIPEIELNPNGFPDIGAVSWDGEDLIEAGVLFEDGREISYLERWQRLPQSDGELLALSCPNGRLVRTGRYALTILDERPEKGSFAAVAWTLKDESWTVHHCWPTGATAPAPPSAITDGDATVRLSDGTEWTIDEHRKVVDTSGFIG